MPLPIIREEVIQMLRHKQGKLSLRQFAKELGCSPMYLSDLYNGRRDPGPLIMDYLGLARRIERQVSYYKKPKG